MSPPAAHAGLFHKRPQSATGEDAVGAVVGPELVAVVVGDASPARVDVRRLEQPALAGSAVGEIGTALVGCDPAAPGVDLRIFQRPALSLVLLTRRLGAFD